MVLGPMGGKDRWLEPNEMKKSINQEDAQLRSLITSFTPPK
jgi:hypothetical protein